MNISQKISPVTFHRFYHDWPGCIFFFEAMAMVTMTGTQLAEERAAGAIFDSEGNFLMVSFWYMYRKNGSFWVCIYLWYLIYVPNDPIQSVKFVFLYGILLWDFYLKSQFVVVFSWNFFYGTKTRSLTDSSPPRGYQNQWESSLHGFQGRNVKHREGIIWKCWES